MTKYKIELSKLVRDNYVFYCPDAPIHLNLCQPVGYVDRLTSSILRGIKGGTLIDCDNLLATLEEKEEVVEPPKSDEEVIEPQKDLDNTSKEKKVAKKSTNKRTKKEVK